MKRLPALLMVLVLAVSFVFSSCRNREDKEPDGTKSSVSDTEEGDEKRPDTWIADRQLSVKVFMMAENVLPSDQVNNPVAQEIKKRTGITMVYDTIKTTDEDQEMTLYLASGDFHDLMLTGTLHTTSPMFPIVIKAAREGMFTDIVPLIKDTAILGKYLEKGYLPIQARDDIIFREEFGDKAYILQLGVERPGSQRAAWIAGIDTYVREDIAKALDVDISQIKTQDQLYEFAKKIKDGNFKDKNGNPLYPIGAHLFGNSDSDPERMSYLWRNWDFGNRSGFDYDGNVVKHVAFTDYVYKRIGFVRKLLAEGLLHREAFSIASTRTQEDIANGSYAMTSMHVHSQTWDTGAEQWAKENPGKRYIPVGPMLNYKGEVARTAKIEANDCLMIPKTTKNPEEVIKFIDFMASREGKLLWQYGLEGKHYEEKDSKIYPKEWVMNDLVEAPKTLIDEGFIAAGGIWGNIGGTDYAPVEDFGQYWFGELVDNTKWAFGESLLKIIAPEVKYVSGYAPEGVLQGYENEMTLKPVIDAFDDAFVKAVFAGSMDEARDIMETYKSQLKKAGIDDFCELLQKQDEKEPGIIIFYLSS